MGKFNRTTWVDGQTPVTAAEMNRIEAGIDKALTDSLTSSSIVAGNGIKTTLTEDGRIEVSSNLVVTRPLPVYDPAKIYLVTSPETGELAEIVIGGVTKKIM